MRPAGEWLPFTGKSCPVNPQTLVMIRLVNGRETGPFTANKVKWARGLVTHYRSVQHAPD